MNSKFVPTKCSNLTFRLARRSQSNRIFPNSIVNFHPKSTIISSTFSISPSSSSTTTTSIIKTQKSFHSSYSRILSLLPSTNLQSPRRQQQQPLLLPYQFHSIRNFSNNNNNNNNTSKNNKNKNNKNNENDNNNNNDNNSERIVPQVPDPQRHDMDDPEFASGFERRREEAKTMLEELHETEYEELTPGEKQKMHRTATVLSWRTVLLGGMIILFCTALVQQIYFQKQQQTNQDRIQTYGEAMVGGGEWQMKDHNGNDVNQTTFLGKYQIVYFGFTFCPDVCPRELAKLAQALQILEERGYGNDIVPIFVSVDPKRDTPALIRKYIRQFHPKIVGLTGSPEQVAKFAHAYKAYYSTPGPLDNPDDYIVDHITMMYFMGRGGEYLGHVSTLENAHEMVDKVTKMMKDVGPSGGFFGKFLNNPKSLIGKTDK